MIKVISISSGEGDDYKNMSDKKKTLAAEKERLAALKKLTTSDIDVHLKYEKSWQIHSCLSSKSLLKSKTITVVNVV